MAFVRTFGQLKPSKPVHGVSVRVVTDGVARVTDVQLNPGSSLFSWSPMVGDLGLRASPAWRYINGMVQSDYDTWVMSDEDLASPYRGVVYPVGTQRVRWGMLDMGDINSRQEFDGYDYTTTSGAGFTPHLTARSDQRLDLQTDGIMSAIVAVRGIHSDPGDPSRPDLGTVTEAHPDGWSAVWAWHESWSDVLSEHGGW
ncbi:hypothetical protein SEA_THERESITA_21 [Microbacterium phage Theresita]|nr:hypothetical protein SEA_THERESITA_21 [Microbacterium phage Theresita]